MAETPLRPSTTVLLVRDGPNGLEVLMVVRQNDRSQYASAMVFPGGTVDASDAGESWVPLCGGADDLDVNERARRIAGFRELHEEAGILLVTGTPKAIKGRAKGLSFQDLVRSSGGRLELSAMVPFAHWITPEGAPKRYDVFFRLCWLQTDMTAVSDGSETISAEWLRPSEALALGASGERHLLFPTKSQLELLDQSGTVEDAVAAAKVRRIIPVSPRIERREDGAILSIPSEAGYPICEFRMPAA